MENKNQYYYSYDNFKNFAFRDQELKKSPLNSNRYTMTSTNISTKFSTEENNNNNLITNNLKNNKNE